MKKLVTVLTITMLLSYSCENNYNEEDFYVTVEEKRSISYCYLREVENGYMCVKYSHLGYAYKDVVSYEIVDIEGDPGILSHYTGYKYSPQHKVNLLTLTVGIDLTAQRWNQILNTVDLNKDFLTFTLRLKLKRWHKTY